MQSTEQSLSDPDQLLLFQDKKPAAAILVGSNPSETEKHAAKELIQYFERIGDVHLIVYQPGETIPPYIKSLIVIGTPSTNEIIHQAVQAGELTVASRERKYDAYTIKITCNRIWLCGTIGREVLYAAYDFLERFLRVGFFWDGDVIHTVDQALLPTCEIHECSAFRERYNISISGLPSDYNFGTLWYLPEWKKELDWLAKNRYNIYLHHAGNEYVRKMTYRKLGVACEPVNFQDICRMEETKTILGYARMLGLDPGVRLPDPNVTEEFESAYPGSKYMRCKWYVDTPLDKDQSGPPYLFTGDPMYVKLIETFITTWDETYGKSVAYWALVPAEARMQATPQEIKEVYVKFPQSVRQAINRVNPEGILLMDGWCTRDSGGASAIVWNLEGAFSEFVDHMDPDKDILIDYALIATRPDGPGSFPLYHQERFKDIRRRKCCLAFLNEFGGEDFLHGDMRRALDILLDGSEPENAACCSGSGVTTELMYYNIHFYDLLSKACWNPRTIDLPSYLADLAERRYGKLDGKLHTELMEKLVDSVYSDLTTSDGCHQHRLYPHISSSGLMPPVVSLATMSKLDSYIALMISQVKNIIPQKPAAEDLYDVMRQYITELFNINYIAFIESFQFKQQERFTRSAKAMLSLLDLLEELVRSNPTYRIADIVDHYKGRIPEVGVNDPEARVFLTPDQPNTAFVIKDMHLTFAHRIPAIVDYQSQDYYEQIKYYDRPRVEVFIDRMALAYTDDVRLDNEELTKIYHEIEENWISSAFPAVECTHTRPLCSEAILEVYNKLKQQPDLKPLISDFRFPDIGGSGREFDHEKNRWVE